MHDIDSISFTCGQCLQHCGEQATHRLTIILNAHQDTGDTEAIDMCCFHHQVQNHLWLQCSCGFGMNQNKKKTRKPEQPHHTGRQTTCLAFSGLRYGRHDVSDTRLADCLVVTRHIFENVISFYISYALSNGMHILHNFSH
jgi:hypothetical protein